MKCEYCDFESPSDRLVQIHFEAEHEGSLIEWIARGQRAQKAVDKILAEVGANDGEIPSGQEANE